MPTLPIPSPVFSTRRPRPSWRGLGAVCFALAALAALALTPPARADLQVPGTERGFAADAAFAVGDLDSVNLFNGNLSIQIPIGQRYRANGSLQYQLTLTYNSKVWDWGYVKPISVNQRFPGALVSAGSNAGMGWRLSLGELLPPLEERNEFQLRAYRNESDSWVYVDPAGAEHRLSMSSAVHSGVSRDGSYLRLRDEGSLWALDFPDGMVHRFSRDGRLVSISDPFGNTLTVTYVGDDWWISDGIRTHRVVFRSEPVEVEGGSIRWRPLVDKVVLAAFGGQTAEYDFQYERQHVERPVGHDDANLLTEDTCPEDAEKLCAYTSLLASVELPDGSSYRMTGAPGIDGYFLRRETLDLGEDGPDPDTSPDVHRVREPGVLRTLQVPTGARYVWDYGLYRLPSGWEIDVSGGLQPLRDRFFSEVQGVVRKRTLDPRLRDMRGSWFYHSEYTFDTVQVGSEVREEPIRLVTRMLDPEGNLSEHYFNPQIKTWAYGLPYDPRQQLGGRPLYLSTRVTPALGGGVRTGHAGFTSHGDCEVDWTEGLYDCHRPLLAKRSEDGHGNWTENRREDLSRFGQPRREIFESNHRGESPRELEVTTRDVSDRFPGPNTPWVLNLFTESTTTANFQGPSQSSQTTIRREFCFDERTGTLLRERHLVGASRSPRDVVISRWWGGQGNLAGQAYHGGHGLPLSTGPLCSIGLPTASYLVDHLYEHGSLRKTKDRGSSISSLDLSIDRNTGLPTEASDPAGLRTAYTFDRSGRLVEARPESGAQTRIHYANAWLDGSSWNESVFASVVVEARKQGGGLLDQERYVYDSLGRLVLERQLEDVVTGEWLQRRTSYKNAMGWLASVSTWWRTDDLGDHGRGWTSYLRYDGYGRALTVQAPDGDASSDYHVTRFQYQGTGGYTRTRSVGTAWDGEKVVESGKSVSFDLDGRGRIWRVREPIQGAGATYWYDVHGELATVRVSPMTGGGSQTRSFDRDGRGFLVREVHPETGATTFSRHDAKGLAWRSWHETGGRTLDMTWDRDERLTHLWEVLPGGGSRELQRFVYAQSNQNSTWEKGKLRKAIQWNYRALPWDPATEYAFQVEEEYSYSGTGGRTSRRITRLDGDSRVFDQGWTWDELGDLETVRYPECTHQACDGQGGPDRTIRYRRGAGRLYSVDGVVQSFTYHPNGELASIRRVNGVIDEIDMDPSYRPLPLEIRVRFPGGVESLGQHRYDGSGNLVQRAAETEGPCPPGATCADYYLYDGLSRLKLFNDGSGERERYGYDAFGNLVFVEWLEAGTGWKPLGRHIPVDAGTNRLTGPVTLDPYGNLTSRFLGGSHETYQWDAQDRLASRNGGEEIYLYTVDGHRIDTFRWSNGQFGGETFTLRDLDGKILRAWDYDSPGGQEVWTWKEDTVRAGGRILASFTGESGPRRVLHYSNDHLGSPRLVTDANGSPVEDHHYLGFGRETGVNQNNPRLAYRFTGHERDQHDPGPADTLDYMGARYYSPWLNRFLSADPVLGKVESPQSWNRYAYAANNPLKYVDPDGRAVETFLDVAGLGYDVYELVREPSWKNAGILVLDIGLTALPGVPSVGGVKLAGRVAGVGDQARSVIILGENMRDRVRPVASQMGDVATFGGQASSKADLLEMNLDWLKTQVDNGATVLDVGMDVGRDRAGRPGSDFYRAEVAFMQNRGYVRRFSHVEMVQGNRVVVWKWQPR